LHALDLCAIRACVEVALLSEDVYRKQSLLRWSPKFRVVIVSSVLLRDSAVQAIVNLLVRTLSACWKEQYDTCKEPTHFVTRACYYQIQALIDNDLASLG
jgi:hypothetical protein